MMKPRICDLITCKLENSQKAWRSRLLRRQSRTPSSQTNRSSTAESVNLKTHSTAETAVRKTQFVNRESGVN